MSVARDRVYFPSEHGLLEGTATAVGLIGSNLGD